jgi:hypothetical protein
MNEAHSLPPLPSAFTLLHSLTSSPWCDVMGCDVIDLDFGSEFLWLLSLSSARRALPARCSPAFAYSRRCLSGVNINSAASGFARIGSYPNGRTLICGVKLGEKLSLCIIKQHPIKENLHAFLTFALDGNE